MLDCLIIGDSIAQGISMFRHECHHIVQKGINSMDFVKQHPNLPWAQRTIISLGANDYNNMTEHNITEMRVAMTADIVFWVLPNNNEDARRAIIKLAKNCGDRVIDLRKEKLSKDHVHPTMAGYKSIAKKTKKNYVVPV